VRLMNRHSIASRLTVKHHSRWLRQQHTHEGDQAAENIACAALCAACQLTGPACASCVAGKQHRTAQIMLDTLFTSKLTQDLKAGVCFVLYAWR
jgi:hypothetical protein